MAKLFAYSNWTQSNHQFGYLFTIDIITNIGGSQLSHQSCDASSKEHSEGGQPGLHILPLLKLALFEQSLLDILHYLTEPVREEGAA